MPTFRRSTWVFLLLAAAIACAAGISWGLLLGWVRVPQDQTASRDNWTHKELIGYLEGQGVPFRAAHAKSGAWPAMYFFPTRITGLAEMTSLTDQHFDDIPQHMECVRVEKTPSASYARDHAATFGSRGFAWGRFVFRAGDKELLAAIKKALP